MSESMCRPLPALILSEGRQRTTSRSLPMRVTHSQSSVKHFSMSSALVARFHARYTSILYSFGTPFRFKKLVQQCSADLPEIVES